jgi:hypothetical protein
MDASETAQNQYASFLVRLWRSAEPRSTGSTDDWQGEVEHIQSGRRSGFTSRAELWEILCRLRDTCQVPPMGKETHHETHNHLPYTDCHVSGSVWDTSAD